MSRTAWAALLVGVTLLAAVASALREAIAGDRAESSATRGSRPPRRGLTEVGYTNIAAGTLALAIAVGAVALARHAADSDRGPGFTELATLPAPAGRTDERLSIEVVSHERRAMTYRLVLRQNGLRTAVWSGLRLAPGGRLRVSSSRLRDRTKVARVLLFDQASAAPYRQTVVYRTPATAPPARRTRRARGARRTVAARPR